LEHVISHIIIFYRYDQYQTDDAAADGGRKLNGNQNVQYVDCETCDTKGCWANMNNENGNNNNGDEAITDEGIAEWAQQMSECSDTGVAWNDINLRASFMCNGDGTGVEIAIFLDEDCTIYSSLQSYADIMPYDYYAQQSQTVVTYPFIHDISCAEQVEWDSPEEQYNNDGNNNNNNNNNGEEPEANEFCQELVQSETVLPIENCGYLGGADDEEDNNNNNNEDESEYAGYFTDYTYDLTEDDLENAYTVCTVINTIEYSEGFTQKKKNNAYHNTQPAYDYSARKSSSTGGGKAAGITMLVLLIVGAAGFVGFKTYTKQMDSKKQPLVVVDSAYA
jgi:hypothetical protein